MTREEYYAAIQAYKEGKSLQHRMMDANSEDTSSKALDNWKKQYFNQAVALKAKYNLAKLSGRNDDADTYEKQLNIIMDRLTNISGVSLSAKQALAKEVDTTGTQKANVQIAKHSDESDEVLEHGGEWKKHKYIRIENGRYIYEDDLIRERRKKAAEEAHKNASSYLDKAGKYLDNTEAWEGEARWQKTHGTKVGVEDAKKVASESEKKFYDNLNKASKFFDERDRLNAINKQPVIRDDDLKDEERRRNESAAKAQKEGEAMQAWKDAKKSKSNENARAEIEETGSISKETKTESSRQSLESASKAQREGEAMQAWKNAQNAKAAAAEIRKGSDSARKAQAEGELQQLWKDYNNTEKINSSIDDAIEKFSNKFDNAANYKTKNVIGNNLSKENYNAFMKPAVTYFLYSLHGMTDFKKAESNGKIPDVSEFVRSLDKMADDPKALYRKLLNDAGRIAMDIAEEYKFSELAKATKVRHSFDLSTKEGYYAAIAEYKKKA